MYLMITIKKTEMEFLVPQQLERLSCTFAF